MTAGTETAMAKHDDTLEAQIAQWRAYLRRRPAIRTGDVEELESHLRDQVTALVDAGLAADEAFLVAVKRMGSLDAVSREFAREHSERLWKQLVAAPEGATQAERRASSIETIVVVGLAAAAGLAVKLPELFGYPPLVDVDEELLPFYFRNMSFFVLPILAGYFAWKRRLDRRDACALRWCSPRPPSSSMSFRSHTAVTRFCSRRCTCRSHCGWWWASPTPADAGATEAGAWTSCASPASCSSTTC